MDSALSFSPDSGITGLIASFTYRIIDKASFDPRSEPFPPSLVPCNPEAVDGLVLNETTVHTFTSVQWHPAKGVNQRHQEGRGRVVGPPTKTSTCPNKRICLAYHDLSG